MPRQEIILGTPPTGLGGDPPRVASMKINAMTLELYDKTNNLGSVASENVVPVEKGGTGGITQAAARTGLGLKGASIVDVIGTMTSGAIIERGSNANGEFTRFADGTQICTAMSVGYTANTVKFGSFPIAFASNPSVSASVYPAAGYDSTWSIWVNDPGGWVFASTLTASSNRIIITAIGRWK